MEADVPGPNDPMMYAMNALQAKPHGAGMNPGDTMGALGGFHQAKMDWRADRPMFDPATMERGDFRQQMMDWRGQRPDHQSFGQPVPGNTGIVPPQAPNTQMPINPAAPQGMVGQSYGVQGLLPGVGQYGLPRY